jgi:hypothetical protein
MAIWFYVNLPGVGRAPVGTKVILLEKRTLSGGGEIDQIIATSLARQDLEVEKKRRADMAQMAENARAFAAYREEKDG